MDFVLNFLFLILNLFGIWSLEFGIHFLRSRMKRHYIAPQVIPVEVRIDFGGGYRCMAEHFLHRPQIGAAFDEMGGKRMAESMRTDRLSDAGFFCQAFNDVKDHHPGNLFSSSI